MNSEKMWRMLIRLKIVINDTIFLNLDMPWKTDYSTKIDKFLFIFKKTDWERFDVWISHRFIESLYEYMNLSEKYEVDILHKCNSISSVHYQEAKLLSCQ